MARVINRHSQGVKTIRPGFTRRAKQCNEYNDTCLIKVVILNGRFINAMITRCNWHLIKNVLKNVFVLISYANKLTFIMNKKQQRQKKVLIPSMYSANYSKSKNMSVDTVCIKRLKFACMTIYDYSKSRDYIVSSMSMFHYGYAIAACS